MSEKRIDNSWMFDADNTPFALDRLKESMSTDADILVSTLSDIATELTKIRKIMERRKP